VADDATPTDDAPLPVNVPPPVPVDATPVVPVEATPPTATETHTPVLELPAAPRDLRPSPLAREDTPPRPTPTLAPRSTAMSEATAEALAHLRQEGAWRTALRIVGVVAALTLCLRLVFDDALPRLLLGLGGALVAALVVARVLHAWSVARRRRAMLEALDLLTRVGNAHPDALTLFAPQIASLVDALRQEDQRFSQVSPDEVILRALRPGPVAPAPRGE
jgi:hypothetical protein